MTQEPNSRSDQLAVTTENALLPRSSPAPGVPFDSSSLRLRKQTPAGSSEVGSLGRLDTPPAYIWLLIGCLSWSEHRWRGLRLRFQRRCQLSLVCCCYLLFAASAGFLESLQHRRHVSGNTRAQPWLRRCHEAGSWCGVIPQTQPRRVFPFRAQLFFLDPCPAQTEQNPVSGTFRFWASNIFTEPTTAGKLPIGKTSFAVKQELRSEASVQHRQMGCNGFYRLKD